MGADLAALEQDVWSVRRIGNIEHRDFLRRAAEPPATVNALGRNDQARLFELAEQLSHKSHRQLLKIRKVASAGCRARSGQAEIEQRVQRVFDPCAVQRHGLTSELRLRRS